MFLAEFEHVLHASKAIKGVVDEKNKAKRISCKTCLKLKKQKKIYF